MYVSIAKGYALRNDSNGSFIIKINRTPDTADLEMGVLTLPPFIGKILSLLGTKPYEENVRDISDKTGLSVAALKHFLEQLIENDEARSIRVGKYVIVFPKNFLKRYDSPTSTFIYETEGFDWHEDIRLARPTAPVNVNLMVTTKCTTDCNYCYAKRSLQPLLTTEELVGIVKSLRKNGVVNLSLTGGDIFAHKGWKSILKVVREEGYNPFVSTKTPISRDEVKFLSEIGCTDIQFSLDAADPTILSTLIKSEAAYIEKVRVLLEACEHYGLRVSIRSVLTSLNSDLSTIKQLYDFITLYGCVVEWTLTPAFFSEYKEEYYNDLEVDNKQLKQIYPFLVSKDRSIPILLSKINEKGYELKRFNTVEEFANNNVVCLANSTTISILANGLCVVCEMTYEHPELILGDIREHSITEIWNSSKALHLYATAQTELAKDSPCSCCSVYDRCKRSFGKRICYMDIFKTGLRLDDPDPKCPMAPATDKIL